MTLVIILGIAVVLFVLAFLTKRRFGVLGLGVAAGVVLSQIWAATLSGLLEAQAVPVQPLSYSTAGQLVCVLLPALVLLIAGPKYHDKKRALIGSLLFAVFATLFVMGPVSRDFAVTGDSSPVFEFLNEWQNVLVGAGVILAVIDTLFSHKSKAPYKGKSKH